MLEGAGQFLKTVGQFDAIAVELESQGDARVVPIEFSQCCLRGRVMGECNPATGPERGAECYTDQKIEQAVARKLPGCFGCEALPQTAIDQ